MTTNCLILGAKSAIAVALARHLASVEGCDLILAARRSEELAPLATDLRLHHERRVALLEYDALALDQAAGLPARAAAAGGDFDLVIQVFGLLGQQRQDEHETDAIVRLVQTNFTGAAVALAHLADYLEARGTAGGIIGIGSVAGDRGRQSNYLYGAAKGGLALYLAGLRHRLAATPVHVLTVKPGFVDTPMTQGLEGLFLVAPPERVARDIMRAYRRRRNVLYTPWFWRYIMLLIRLVPEPVFKRTGL